MPLRVGFLQREPSAAHGAFPRDVELSLLAAELAERGHEIHCWITHPTALGSVAEDARRARIQLLVLDSTFPVDAARRLGAGPDGFPVVAVGARALSLFEQARLRFALVGPARKALPQLCRRLAEVGAEGASPAALDDVPNLFFRSSPPAAPPDTPRAAEPAGAAAPVRVDCSSAHASWSAADELLPYHPRLIWEYRGSTRLAPPTAEFALRYECPGPDRAGHRVSPPQGGEPEPSPPAEYTARAWNRVRQIYLDPRGACPFCGLLPRPAGTNGVPSTETATLLAEQIHWLWTRGQREFAIRGRDPFPALKELIERLRSGRRLPRRLRLQVPVAVLRKREPMILELVRIAAQNDLRIALTGIPFDSFLDRALALHGHGVTHWENRRAARFLRHLERTHPGTVEATRGHRLVLFDPWTRLDELLENLSAIEEDAPFLKTAVQLDSRWTPDSPYSPVARRARADGLLRSLPGPGGLEYDFAHPEIPLFLDLAARGLAPLLEAIGRMRLHDRARRRFVVEGRFRWFRELALYLQATAGTGRRPEDGWGQVLASVAGELGLDAARPPSSDRV
jgi:hypothetical protein